MFKLCLSSSYSDKKYLDNIFLKVETGTDGRVPGNDRETLSAFCSGKKTFCSGKKRNSSREVSGKVRESGIDMYTLLYLKWITNEDLLYSTGNFAQYYVVT